MNPASTRHGSRNESRRESGRPTSRPRVLDVSSPLESQVASVEPHQESSLPGTPTSQGPSVPGTPTSQGPSVPGTPTSQEPSVPGTPTSQGPSVPGTPTRQEPSVPRTPYRQGPSVPRTPYRQGPSVPRTPFRQGPSVPRTPFRQGPSVPRTPIRLGPSVPRTPYRQRSFVHTTPSSQRPFVRATPSSQRPLVRGTSSTRSLQSVHRDRFADKLPKKYIQPGKGRLTQLIQGPKKIKIPEAIKTRAEGQARVSKKFRDSFKNFCFSADGMLKILRMCMTAASVFCLTIGGAQELFVVIMIQETCIVLFFIIIYLVTLQDTLACIHWPLLDMINTLISTVFIGIIGIIVIGEENTKDLCYTGAMLCLLAAILCVIDALLVAEKMRRKAKNSLPRETKPSATRLRQKQR